MKRKFSTSWLSSTQPRKQRKYRAKAPLHTKHKFLNAPLSKSLREKYGKRSLPLKKGDEVLVMRGNFKKKKAIVTSVELKRSRVALENIQRSKRDGTKVSVYFQPSSLQIQNPTLEDQKRLTVLNRKSKETSKSTKQTEKENAPEKTKSNN
jgi:large subunit ribosomal protein L24